ncbi:hypothetical protein BH23ACT11_BH23ACT11_10110 [soil metagenome]
MDRTDTKIDRELLEALKVMAQKEGRGEYEAVEDAARFYLSHGPKRGVSVSESLDRARERRRASGVRELSEEEAMKIAVEEQHAYRRGE